MFGPELAAAAEAQGVTLTGTNYTFVVAVAAIAVVALVMAFVFRAQVLAADEGTEKMKEIAAAVQEGAAAYLNRQFRTLSVFAVVVRVGSDAELLWSERDAPERALTWAC